MKRNGTEIYALAVCFVAVICAAVTTAVAAYSILGVVAPRFTIDPLQIDSFDTNQTYTRYWPTAKPIPADEELTRMREAELGRVFERERRSRLQIVTKSLVVIVVSLGFFVIHWRLHARSKSIQHVA